MIAQLGYCQRYDSDPIVIHTKPKTGKKN